MPCQLLLNEHDGDDGDDDDDNDCSINKVTSKDIHRSKVILPRKDTLHKDTLRSSSTVRSCCYDTIGDERFSVTADG